MRSFLTKGLAETHSLWTDVEMGYRWVHRAVHLLTNDEKQTASQVRQNYEALLTKMQQAPTVSEPLTTMLITFRKVTASYFPGLFHCYDVAGLPRTNNDLEQYFGSARYHERREERWLHQESSCEVQPVWWQVLRLVSVIFVEQISNQQTSSDGISYETNWTRGNNHGVLSFGFTEIQVPILQILRTSFFS